MRECVLQKETHKKQQYINKFVTTWKYIRNTSCFITVARFCEWRQFFGFDSLIGFLILDVVLCGFKDMYMYCFTSGSNSFSVQLKDTMILFAHNANCDIEASNIGFKNTDLWMWLFNVFGGFCRKTLTFLNTYWTFVAICLRN